MALCQGTTLQAAEKLGLEVELAFRPASRSFVLVIPSGALAREECFSHFFRSLFSRAVRLQYRPRAIARAGICLFRKPGSYVFRRPSAPYSITGLYRKSFPQFVGYPASRNAVANCAQCLTPCNMECANIFRLLDRIIARGTRRELHHRRKVFIRGRRQVIAIHARAPAHQFRTTPQRSPSAASRSP